MCLGQAKLPHLNGESWQQMKRIARIVGLLVAGVILGLPLGMSLVQYKFINKEKALGLVSEEGFLDEYAKKQFIYADRQSAREALTYAVKLHTEMRGSSPLQGWPEKLELGWCYAELSVLEESDGNPKLAGDHMLLAQQILRELGLKDPSESHIRELVWRRLKSDQTESAQSR
jgi:hypothetical protein